MSVGAAPVWRMRTLSLRGCAPYQHLSKLAWLVLPRCRATGAHYQHYHEVGSSARISFTRPTCPVSSRTLIPWGCVGDEVRIWVTIPTVRLPVR